MALPADDAADPGREPDGLRTRLEARIARSGAEVAVAMRTVDGRTELLLAPDLEFHAASTMKVPVMIELWRQAAAGTLSLDDELVLVNEFTSVFDGSAYSLTAGDDSDSEIYTMVGTRRTLRDLCEAMITVSSNLATNVLVDHLGVERIRATVRDLGAEGMNVRRGVEDTKAFQAGLNNTTTARGLLVLFEALARGTAVSADASREMIDVLARQRFNNAIPAGLPPGTRVAHKTGSITRIHHDAGVVFGPRPYVLVVLVRGLADHTASAALIADLTRLVDAALGADGGR
ncbi:MAG: serine hydrolase [Vicinamibacteraceae bacterium]|nr:serine hydrolase [Vicinamibacteraceae bacterium]